LHRAGCSQEGSGFAGIHLVVPHHSSASWQEGVREMSPLPGVWQQFWPCGCFALVPIAGSITTSASEARQPACSITDPSNLPLFHPIAVWSARAEERSSKCFPGLIISIKAFPGLRRGYTLQHAEQEMGSGFPKLPLPARANHKITGGQERCARGFVCPRRD